MNSIKQLCTKGVVLEKGSVVYRGSIIEAVNNYLGSKIDTCKSHTIITDDYRDDNGLLKHELKFEEVWLVNPCVDAIATDEPIVIKVKVRRYDSSVKNARITVIIINELDQRILYCPSQLIQLPNDSDVFCIEDTIKYHGLPKGRYTIRLEASLQSFTQRTKGFDWVHNVLSFEVKYTDRKNKYEYLNWNSFNGLVIPSEKMIETKLVVL
jgi:lipopolysaccharide transport system ATP-binding protein